MSNFIINFSRIILLAILCVTSNISLAMDDAAPYTTSFHGTFKRKRSGNSSDEEGTIGSLTTAETGTGSLLNDPRFERLLKDPGFTFTQAPKEGTVRKKIGSIYSSCEKENQPRVNESIVLEGDWYLKSETRNWVLRLGNGTNATIIPGAPAELLFGSNAYTKGSIFMCDNVEEAKKEAEKMAKKHGLQFKKKPNRAFKGNPFAKRR